MAKVKLGLFIQGLLDKTGVKMDITSQEWKDLNNTSVEIDDTITNELNEKLLTVDSAVENPKVKQRVKAATLDPLDKDIYRLAEEAGLTDALDGLKSETNTRIKVSKLVSLIADAEKKKAGAPSKEKAEYEKDIAKLNGDLKTIREGYEAEKKGLEESHTSKLIDLMLDRELGGYELAPSEFGKDFVFKYAKDSALKALNENKGKLVLDNGSLKVVNAETGAELFDSTNNKVQLKGVLDKSVAPLLKKSDPNKPADKVITIDGNGLKSDAKTATSLTEMAAQVVAE